MKIYLGDNEDTAVLLAAEDFQADIRDVTERTLPIGSYLGYERQSHTIEQTTRGQRCRWRDTC